MRRRLSLLVAFVAGIACPSATTTQEAPAAQGTYHFRPGRARESLALLVRSGDRLRIEAGGCLRSAGRPPRPLLPKERSEEQSLIFIPGVTMGFVPVGDLLGRDFVVPQDLVFPSEPRVWLDWGHFYRSPLEPPSPPTVPPDPCRSPDGEPHVDIRVTPGSPPDRAAEGTLTLVFPRYDANLLPFNPTWAGGGRPSVCGACDGFQVVRRRDGTPSVPAVRSGRCTLQQPSIDSGCDPHRTACPTPRDEGPRRSLWGHIHWGPATFTGTVSTEQGRPISLSRDGDAELFFSPDDGGGVVAHEGRSRYDGRIGLEFETAGTLRWFRSDWWRRFPFRRWTNRPLDSFFGPLWHPGSGRRAPTLNDLPATVIGLFGLDNAHEPHAELHPLYAIAIQTQADADREVWQVFARNWGGKGGCGQGLNHTLDLPRVALFLKAAHQGRWASASGAFSDHGLAVEDWRVYAGAGGPTLVIDLPRNRACSVVEGTLTLRRRKEAAASDHLVAAEPPVGEPARWNATPAPSQLCIDEAWFLRVP